MWKSRNYQCSYTLEGKRYSTLYTVTRSDMEQGNVHRTTCYTPLCLHLVLLLHLTFIIQSKAYRVLDKTTPKWDPDGAHSSA